MAGGYGAGVSTRSPRTHLVWALLADAACVVAFAAGGRSTHAEPGSLTGVASTAWPFLVGLALGWALVLTVLRRPTSSGDARRGDGFLRIVPAGLALVLATWGVGMGLRLATDQGASGAFPLVALAFLAATLLGWRAVVALVSPRAPRGSAAPGPGRPGHGG